MHVSCKGDPAGTDLAIEVTHMKAPDKIRILLIDDSPDALLKYTGEEELPMPPHPGMTDDFGSSLGVNDLFELRWIATASEGREFRDWSRLIAQRSPEALGVEGWVPEVVVVDYMLLDSKGTVESRLKGHKDLVESPSPLPALRRLGEREQLRLEYKCEPLAWAPVRRKEPSGLRLHRWGDDCGPVFRSSQRASPDHGTHERHGTRQHDRILRVDADGGYWRCPSRRWRKEKMDPNCDASGASTQAAH